MIASPATPPLLTPPPSSDEPAEAPLPLSISVDRRPATAIVPWTGSSRSASISDWNAACSADGDRGESMRRLLGESTSTVHWEPTACRTWRA